MNAFGPTNDAAVARLKKEIVGYLLWREDAGDALTPRLAADEVASAVAMLRRRGCSEFGNLNGCDHGGRVSGSNTAALFLNEQITLDRLPRHFQRVLYRVAVGEAAIKGGHGDIPTPIFGFLS